MTDLNKPLISMQQSIDKEFSGSPSPFMHWLKPIPVSLKEVSR